MTQFSPMHQLHLFCAFKKNLTTKSVHKNMNCIFKNLVFRPKKILSMCPVVHIKTVLHDAVFFIFKSINRKIVMHNLFLHTNNYIGRSHIFLDISFASKSEQTQIFDLTNKH